MKDIKLINFIDLSQEEKMMILEWRNKIDIQKWMHTQNDISLEEHLDFIDSLKTIKDKLYFLVKKEDENIGVVYFTNLTKKEVYFGLYANPTIKTLGVGRILEEISIDFVFNSLNARKLKLEVFEDNIQVINLHRKYNFKKSGEKFVDNKKVICMELNNIDLIIKVKND